LPTNAMRSPCPRYSSALNSASVTLTAKAASLRARTASPSIFTKRESKGEQQLPVYQSARSSREPQHLIRDIADASPLLFLNVQPAYQQFIQRELLELWFTVTVLYFSAGFLILTATYPRLDDPHGTARCRRALSHHCDFRSHSCPQYLGAKLE